jgi:hypothetical protein
MPSAVPECGRRSVTTALRLLVLVCLLFSYYRPLLPPFDRGSTKCQTRLHSLRHCSLQWNGPQRTMPGRLDNCHAVGGVHHDSHPHTLQTPFVPEDARSQAPLFIAALLQFLSTTLLPAQFGPNSTSAKLRVISFKTHSQMTSECCFPHSQMKSASQHQRQ